MVPAGPRPSPGVLSAPSEAVCPALGAPLCSVAPRPGSQDTGSLDVTVPCGVSAGEPAPGQPREWNRAARSVDGVTGAQRAPRVGGDRGQPPAARLLSRFYGASCGAGTWAVGAELSCVSASRNRKSLPIHRTCGSGLRPLHMTFSE